MALMNTYRMLKQAQDKRYAIGAFNIENMEMAQAVIEAAEEMNAPVILATSTSTLKYAPPETFFAMVKSLATKTKIPIALHLDHGDSYELCVRAIKAGFTSVMIDGSAKEFKENVKISKTVKEIGQLFDVSVETELGAIAGKGNTKIIFTKPEIAQDFVEKTGTDSLAVAIGTCHGIYRETPKLDYERLSQIKSVVNVPLVLHGASGLSTEQIRECIVRGICKINIATELRIAYTDEISKFLHENPEIFDPRVYGRIARTSVKKVVKEKIQILGSDGQGGL